MGGKGGGGEGGGGEGEGCGGDVKVIVGEGGGDEWRCWWVGRVVVMRVRVVVRMVV